ncbi:MAG TPA: extracellular solute-binding protein [Candidatus Limnocylindrales bacterium]|nr:extracellular solute-binding protein [Candidatus Limnocylindrales bacterium]
MARFPRLLTLPLAAVMILSACSGGATPVPAGSGGASTPPASTGASSEPGGSAVTGGSITVTSLWGGAEQENFQKVLDAFKAKTGIEAKYESVRDNYATALQTRISGGNPPDVAILPGIGFLRRFAKDGSIKKVSELGIDAAALQPNYAPGILEIGSVDGELYAIMVKFNSKSTFWYRPGQLSAASVTPPKTWEEFTAALKTLVDKGNKPLGLGAKDDWTLTDWFESIYVRQAGPEAYDKLFSKDGDWTDPSVATAVKSMTDVLNDTNVEGGIKAALGRGFVDGIAQAFSATAKADMYYEGGFVGGIITGQVNKDAKLGTDADWFDFPSINGGNGVTIGGDVIAALTTNPGVKEFMQYMASAEAGAVWAATGAIISPVKGVDASVYPNDQVKREAAQVANATAVRFDGSDLLPGGGPNLGAELQKAIQGQTVDWASFQQQIQTAWSNE